MKFPFFVIVCETMSHYPEKTTALDFKDAAAPGFGHSDVVFCSFLVTNIKKIPPFNHQQKWLITKNFGVVDIKSNYFVPVKP